MKQKHYKTLTAKAAVEVFVLGERFMMRFPVFYISTSHNVHYVNLGVEILGCRVKCTRATSPPKIFVKNQSQQNLQAL